MEKTWSTSLETPRARCEVASNKSSLSRDRGYRTRRRKETSHRCCKQRGDLHNTNSRLCPNESVRLSSSPVCCIKGLKIWCGSNGLQQVTSNSGRCINGKHWTRVHSSLEVLSLDKQQGMQGKQITAGQLTGT